MSDVDDDDDPHAESPARPNAERIAKDHQDPKISETDAGGSDSFLLGGKAIKPLSEGNIYEVTHNGFTTKLSDQALSVSLLQICLVKC